MLFLFFPFLVPKSKVLSIEVPSLNLNYTYIVDSTAGEVNKDGQDEDKDNQNAKDRTKGQLRSFTFRDLPFLPSVLCRTCNTSMYIYTGK